MTFTRKPLTFKTTINALTFGSGAQTVTLGGGNTLPLCYFDAPPPQRPAIGAEISDLPSLDMVAAGLPLMDARYHGADSMAERARRAAAIEGVNFICLHLAGADPGGQNHSVAECVAAAQEVVAATSLPLAITGCKNVEKDAAIFVALAESLQGKNILFLSAREENYKQVGAAAALAYGHKVGAATAVDINLAKQLNVLMTQLGVPGASIAMNVGGAAAGYGFEYVASTMDRVRSAALEQEDAMLRMPIVTLVGPEAWSVKEALVSAEDEPAWGPREERGIMMETVTAAACLASGSDAVVLRHPAAIEKIAALVAAL